MSPSLLELPSLVLDEICMYLESDGEWNLSKLTECCKFLKGFIENSPRLMYRLCLNVDIGRFSDPKSIVQYRENLASLMASTRKYTEIVLTIRDPITFSVIENENLNFKALFDKHASSARVGRIQLKTQFNSFNMKALSFIEKMKNLKEAQLIFDIENISEEAYDDTDATMCADNHLEKLEHLEIENNASHPSFFKFFQHCRNLKSLNLTVDAAFQIEHLIAVVRNCRESLTDLTFYSDGENYDRNKFLRELRAFGLKLEEFHHEIRDMTEESALKFMEFLGTQRKLKKLEIFGNSNLNFFIRFGEILQHLDSLTDLYLELDCLEAPLVQEFNWKTWDITRIQNLHLEIIEGANQEKTNRLAQKIFQSQNKNLKKLVVSGFDLQGNIFETIVKNYDGLQELKLFDCNGVKSDDIFLILKHLKQLTKLSFEFPRGSPIDSALFNTNDDLVLPNIQNVRFFFNEYISSQVLSNLAKYIKNVSDFFIRPVDNEQNLNVNSEYKINLDLLTRELINLKTFTYCGLNGFEKACLGKIESNLKNFNKNPGLFVLNKKRIDEWKSVP